MLIFDLTRQLRALSSAAAPVGRALARRALRAHDGRKKKIERPEFLHLFADLVILAGWLHPIPFRTRP